MTIFLKLRHLLAAPIFGDEDTRRTARLLHFILLILIGAALAFALGIVFLAPDRLHRLPITILFSCVPLAHLIILRQGYVRQTSVSLVSSLWLGITWANFTGGGIHHPGYGANVVVVGIAALLLGGRWALGFAGLSAIAGLMMIMFAKAGFIVEQRAFPPMTTWLIQTVPFIVTALLIHTAARNIYQALGYARMQERLLKERNRQLEQEIMRRQEAEKSNLQLVLERERLNAFRQLISELSHDLKTPLTVINTSLYLLERLDDPQKQKEKIKAIQHQTERLNKFVHDILMLSKLDHVPDLELAPTDIHALLHEIDEEFRSVCEQKSIKLMVNPYAVKTSISVDRDKFYRAILNLLENAVRYTPEGGHIVVQTHNTGKNLMVEVTDSGIGIAETQLPYIFDRFYRVQKEQLSDEKGSGLGLAIVKKIMDIHGGNVVVSSKEGEGTTFQLSLPIEDA